MSVELLDSPRFYGYRVRRQIGGKAYQEYLSLIKDGKRLKGKHRILVKNQAELRDTELKKLQSNNKKKLDKIYISSIEEAKKILKNKSI